MPVACHLKASEEIHGALKWFCLVLGLQAAVATMLSKPHPDTMLRARNQRSVKIGTDLAKAGEGTRSQMVFDLHIGSRDNFDVKSCILQINNIWSHACPNEQIDQLSSYLL